LRIISAFQDLGGIELIFKTVIVKTLILFGVELEAS
jgi:hypothetical protein